MEFTTTQNGGEQHAIAELVPYVEEVKDFFEERFEGVFQPRIKARAFVQELVRHVARQTTDSIHTITDHYSKSSSEYMSLLPYSVKYAHEIQLALKELLSDSLVIGEVSFPLDDDIALITFVPLELSDGQTRLDFYINGLRRQGNEIPREVDRLLEEWKAFAPEEIHLRRESTVDIRYIGRING